jgi:flagellar biosynthesis chaperone FliJ
MLKYLPPASAESVKTLEEVYGSANYADIISDNLHDYAQKNEIPEGVESQLSANYQAFIPFLIDAVKELAAQNEELKARIAAIEQI